MASETLMDKVIRLARIDASPRHSPPSSGAVVLASGLSLAGSLLADALLVFVGTNIFPSTRGYSHFRFFDYATLTVIGVAIACIAWPVVTRLSWAPRWLFFRLAVLVSLVLFLPDLWLLFIRHEAIRAVGVLMVMHVAIALVTYNALVRLAPVSTEENEKKVPGMEDKDAGVKTDGLYRRLAPLLGGMLAVEFVLGIVTLFAVRAGRPSELVPKIGKTIYLAHGLLGLPLGLGAVALLPAVRGAGRTAKVVAWLGFAGVFLAGLGGVLTVSHPLRILGIILMLIGPLSGGVGYLIPLLDRLPREVPTAYEDEYTTDRASST
jgi:hypothetical protein